MTKSYNLCVTEVGITRNISLYYKTLLQGLHTYHTHAFYVVPVPRGTVFYDSQTDIKCDLSTDFSRIIT